MGNADEGRLEQITPMNTMGYVDNQCRMLISRILNTLLKPVQLLYGIGRASSDHHPVDPAPGQVEKSEINVQRALTTRMYFKEMRYLKVWHTHRLIPTTKATSNRQHVANTTQAFAAAKYQDQKLATLAEQRLSGCNLQLLANQHGLSICNGQVRGWEATSALLRAAQRRMRDF